MVANLFKIFLFFTPLIFFKNTSELFEFNKIIFLYISTVLIVSFWLLKSAKERKILFSRTILDWPLLVFLATQFVSSIFSIDPKTSWLGYYSRFNGGFVSSICYSLLYWAFVSNVDKKQIKSIVNYSVAGLIISSIAAFLEHFNIGLTCGLMGLGWNTSCWVQDVVQRVFSTFGQPNWLAAYLAAFIPVTWAVVLKMKDENKTFNVLTNTKGLFYIFASTLFFVVLLFTKSRSGFLGILVSVVVFWGLIIFKTISDNKKNAKYGHTKSGYVKSNLLVYAKEFLAINLLIVLSVVFVGTPWTKSLLTTKSTKTQTKITSPQGPALETGGTESGEIRKIVWEGAVNIWRAHPIVGTGVETFALSYPGFKPTRHNLVSEWDFIYNKAHNEYLNYLATTGSLGFLGYVILISACVYLIYKSNRYEFLAGYLSILVTNFFGFSVVGISALTFLFPALAFVSGTQDKNNNGKNDKKINLINKKVNTINVNTKNKIKENDSLQKISLVGVATLSSTLLFFISRYWYSDILFNKGRMENRSDNPTQANVLLQKAIKLNPREPNFWSEFSVSNAEVALFLIEQNDPEKAGGYIDLSVAASQRAIALSPSNINYKKIYSGILIKLSQYNKNFLLLAASTLESALDKAPTDPKLHYQLGLAYLKAGQNQKGLESLEKAVELKPNYKQARFALGLTYKDFNLIDKTKEQLEYILENIDPNDELTKKYLDELN